MNIRKTIICTLLFLLSFPEIACCMTVEELIKSVDNFVNLRMMEIELASVSKELSGLFEDVKKANELKERWATINGVQLCFFHLEGHVYLCAVRGQGISMIHAASCPCRETGHKETGVPGSKAAGAAECIKNQIDNNNHKETGVPGSKAAGAADSTGQDKEEHR